MQFACGGKISIHGHNRVPEFAPQPVYDLRDPILHSSHREALEYVKKMSTRGGHYFHGLGYHAEIGGPPYNREIKPERCGFRNSIQNQVGNCGF
jgi:hypothetical protein